MFEGKILIIFSGPYNLFTLFPTFQEFQLICRAFEIGKTKHPEVITGVLKKRVGLNSVHIIPLFTQENYRITTMFRKKNISYCFFKVPRNSLATFIAKQNHAVNLSGDQLERLFTSQVMFD